MRFAITILTSVMIWATSLGQMDRFVQVEQQLNTLSEYLPGLNEQVELSVDGVALNEFILAIGNTHQLNISANPDLLTPISNNFANARVKDVLLFLCKEYQLEAEFIGTIISFRKYNAPEEIPEAYSPVKPQVSYVLETDFLSLNLKRDTIQYVAEAITTESGRNVILAPGIEGKEISVFIQNRPFDAALEKMAFANGLIVTKTSDNFYLLSEGKIQGLGLDSLEQEPVQGPSMVKIELNKGMAFSKTDGDLVTVDAVDVPIAEIIAYVSHELLHNYFMYNKPTGNATLYIENASYDEFLSYLLNGTDYTYKNQDDIYLIGARTLEGLRTTKLIQFDNRTMEDMIQYIPADLKSQVEIKEFVDLNGIIVSGSYLALLEIEQFIREIDKVVPMVLIEVMIVDVANTTTFSGGVSAGIGTAPASTGSISGNGGLDLTFTADEVNDLINGVNGYGLINLGNVVPDFYLSIQALEADGMIDIKSTPKLSTLNGHEASLTIGEQEYYLETSNNFIGSENPQQVITNTYKSTSANLSLTIMPVVSADDWVTLDITVQQSDFTERVSEDAPPGKVSRTFDSMIRVKDGEMILLGGLEEKSTSDSGSGVPILSKIPVLKWLFSNRTKQKSKEKLTVFIKPTIIY